VYNEKKNLNYFGGSKMKNIIIIALLISGSLMAEDSVKGNKSGSFSSAKTDGAALYKKRCSVCHGEKATKSPKSDIPALAGRDATRLALKIRSYRDQDNEVGTYTMHKSSRVMKDSTSSLSREQIVALAKYISALK
jgi:cytochrome c553